MSPSITVNYKARNEIHSTTVKVDIIPDSCPLCHKGIEPILRFGWVKFNERKLWLLFECPIQKCGDMFFTLYIRPVKAGIPEDIYEIVGKAPFTVKEEVFPEEYEDLPILWTRKRLG